MSREELYTGREQTLVKHFILQRYLERFAHIVGTHWDALTYVDCFSGPWNVRSHNFEDSSFGIALRELRKARDTHAERGRKLRLRCFFLEKQPAAYAQLEAFANAITDAEVRTRNASLEDSVEEIVNFVTAGGCRSFPFIFVDPMGWTGFGMDAIAPLLRLNPGEVLINFMTGHIRRFIDSPQDETQESFKSLFGSPGFREKIQGLAHQDREDAAVEEYTCAARLAGGFDFACNAVVLHPEIDRTHFNLIYLTRHPEGVKVFKEAEKKAMEVQEAARAEAKQRKRVAGTGQTELFGSKELHDSSHYESLRDRYLGKTRGLVLKALETKRRLPYDEAWALALSEPMSWESDLKEWIEGWKQEGLLEISGMRPRQRVPRRNEGDYLIWK
jgi:three-Cys-motif partner protein